MTVMQEHYNKDKYLIDLFCERNCMSIVSVTSNIIICGRYEYWKIIIDTKGVFALFHESKQQTYFHNGCLIRSYHYQNKHSTSILGILQHIAEHDIFCKSRNRKFYTRNLIKKQKYRGKVSRVLER